jgi:quinol monooxygenase YgiN
MKNLIIATFPAAEGKAEQLAAALAAALPDTRAFDGCIRIDVYQEKGTSTCTIVEDWESFDHYDRYLEWRVEGGLMTTLDELLENGSSGFRVQKFQARNDL